MYTLRAWIQRTGHQSSPSLFSMLRAKMMLPCYRLSSFMPRTCQCRCIITGFRIRWVHRRVSASLSKNAQFYFSCFHRFLCHLSFDSFLKEKCFSMKNWKQVSKIFILLNLQTTIYKKNLNLTDDEKFVSRARVFIFASSVGLRFLDLGDLLSILLSEIIWVSLEKLMKFLL